MTGTPPPPSGRMTPRQAVGWGVAFAVILILIVLFFIYGPQVRPVLG